MSEMQLRHLWLERYVHKPMALHLAATLVKRILEIHTDAWSQFQQTHTAFSIPLHHEASEGDMSGANPASSRIERLRCFDMVVGEVVRKGTCSRSRGVS